MISVSGTRQTESRCDIGIGIKVNRNSNSGFVIETRPDSIIHTMISESVDIVKFVLVLEGSVSSKFICSCLHS